MVTSRDVARVAGVSQATVSRVLSDSPKVRPTTRARVIAALGETDYTPNLLARAMRTRRTGAIGVVVARITNPFYPELLAVLGAELAEKGRHMMVWDSELPGEEAAVEAIRQRLVDGVVFTTVTPASTSLREALQRREPAVLINRGVAGLRCDQVVSDNMAGGRTVASYFLDAGHRRLGLIAGPPQTSTASERERGFREVLRARGIPLGATWCGDFSHDAGRTAMRHFLAQPDPPTAVFCVNDLTAFGALDGARSVGASVPEDVWVVGYDDIPMAAWEAFDLTTVRQPIREMTRLAVRMLLDRIDDPDRPPTQRRLPATLVVRRTTDSTERSQSCST